MVAYLDITFRLFMNNVKAVKSGGVGGVGVGGGEDYSQNHIIMYS